MAPVEGTAMRYSRISADRPIDMPWLPADLFTSNASAAMKITCENAGKFYGLIR
jgi:hypothetical protein